ncbi:hypothetical protein [Solidesulfovibrio alcoholivorans]|nr:hypothetical protein [Solidesulfovibrio alcoholivorans]
MKVVLWVLALAGIASGGLYYAASLNAFGGIGIVLNHLFTPG